MSRTSGTRMARLMRGPAGGRCGMFRDWMLRPSSCELLSIVGKTGSKARVLRNSSSPKCQIVPFFGRVLAPKDRRGSGFGLPEAVGHVRMGRRIQPVDCPEVDGTVACGAAEGQRRNRVPASRGRRVTQSRAPGRPAARRDARQRRRQPPAASSPPMSPLTMAAMPAASTPPYPPGCRPTFSRCDTPRTPHRRRPTSGLARRPPARSG